MEEGSFLLIFQYFICVFPLIQMIIKRFMPLNYWMTDYNTAEKISLSIKFEILQQTSRKTKSLR